MLGSNRASASNTWSDPVEKAYWKKLHEAAGITQPKKNPPGAKGSGKIIDVRATSVEREPNERFICVKLFAWRRAVIRMFDNEDPKVILRERGYQNLEFRDATEEEIAAWRKTNA